MQEIQRDAGGNRTHFDRVAAGCLAIWLQRHRSFKLSSASFHQESSVANIAPPPDAENTTDRYKIRQPTDRKVHGDTVHQLAVSSS